MFHFTKDEETFRTFGTKMLRKKPNLMQLKQLKRVGVDMEAAKIFFQPQDHHYHVDLKNFFGDWNLQYQQEVIVVYQNMQNKQAS